MPLASNRRRNSAPSPQFDFQSPLPSRSASLDAPAFRLANLSPAACRAELRKAKLPFGPAGGPAPGIANALVVTGPIDGVQFVTPGKKSVYGKLDCRLALVLAELAPLLKEHGVTKVLVDNMYRPRARLAGRRVKSQHRYGLAVDVMGFELASGQRLIVQRDFAADLGAPPCGPESTLIPPTLPALELRNLVCRIVRARLFHHVLTPNFNRAHRDHLHLDIKRGARWSVAT